MLRDICLVSLWEPFFINRARRLQIGVRREISSCQAFDRSRRPQDQREPGGRALEGAEVDCREASYDLV